MRTAIRTMVRGFSLIEVLVAVAVVSFGLLALASLQASLTRSSSEVKAQSVALSIAKDKMEEIRSFRDIDGYEALTDSVVTVEDDAGNLGGVDYTVTTTVTRYGYNTDPDDDPDTDDAGFVAADSEIGALSGTFVNENEFKTISVEVEWSDANGETQSVTLEDAIGSVSPENTGRVVRSRRSDSNRKPQVLITNPASDDGVIPVAIGDNSETAATNPKPEVATGVELQTSFNILTYAALDDESGNALAQSQVETVVIGCTCDYDEADADAVSYRPTYWNGERYVVPEEASYDPPAGEANLTGGDPPQSILCSACCRDHHDPNSVTGAKFSPRRNSHTHHLDNLSTAVNSGEYYEACRMIRVDGIYRVAADPYNEYTNVLRTAKVDGATGEDDPYYTDPAPESAASDDYVEFVIDYLETQGLQDDPNVQLSQSAADALAQDTGLNDATQELGVGEERWMHARGLYLDYLEEEALSAITESQDDCAEPLTETQCLLRVLPFTSINVTELADWTPEAEDGEAIAMENGLFTGSSLADEGDQDPVRGKVLGAGDGSAPATATVRTSNTGLLAKSTFEINNDELSAQTKNVADQPDADGQEFEIVGPDCGRSQESIELGAGGSHDFDSTQACASESGQPVATTLIRLNLVLGVGPTDASIVLIAPDTTEYVIVSDQPWSSISSQYLIQASGSPSTSGTWTLRVTNEDNGQDDTTAVGFSIAFLYTATFTAELSGYTFNNSTDPSGSLSGGGSCSFTGGAGAANPATCLVTQPGVPTVWTLGTYNHQVVGTSTDVACTGGNEISCSFNVACRNYDVDGVTINNGATADVGDVNNSGQITESTELEFSSITQGAQVVVTFSSDDEPVTCAYDGSGNKSSCSNYAPACD